MANLFKSDLVGTLKTFFRIATVRLKDSSGALHVRNAGDSAFAALQTAALTATDTVVSTLDVNANDIDLNADAAGSGADWKYTLARPASGMTAAVTLTLPTTNGSPGQKIETDGDGNLSFVTVSGGTDQAKTDTTTLAFGDSSPVTMFTKEAGSLVKMVRVVIDSAFDGTPTMSVGIAGTTSKYSATGEVDLNAAAGTIFEIVPEDAVEAGTEALIITYSAGGATVGSARVLVDTVVPA